MEYRIGRSRHTKRGSVAEIIGDDLIAGCHPNMSAPSSAQRAVSRLQRRRSATGHAPATPARRSAAPRLSERCPSDGDRDTGGLSVTRCSDRHWTGANMDGYGDIRTLRRSEARSAVFGSGGEIGHELYKEFGAGKLDCVDFQSVPTDEAQGARYGFWRLDAARAAQEQTQASGQNADAKNEDGEMNLEETRILFVPARCRRPRRQSRPGGASGSRSLSSRERTVLSLGLRRSRR